MFIRINTRYFPQPARFLARGGKGRAISVWISNSNLEQLLLVFEKKIEAGDVVNGKLAPALREFVKKRGGKRVTHLNLSYEGANDLHRVLGQALKEARRRRRIQKFFGQPLEVLFYMMSKEGNKKGKSE